MDKKAKLLSLAMAGTLMATGTNALASSSSKSNKVKCKGISMKYVNGCGANGHSCSFKAESDFDKNEWLYTKSQADCDAIKTALKNPAIKKYITEVRDTTLAATKRGKKF